MKVEEISHCQGGKQLDLFVTDRRPIALPRKGPSIHGSIDILDVEEFAHDRVTAEFMETASDFVARKCLIPIRTLNASLSILQNFARQSG